MNYLKINIEAGIITYTVPITRINLEALLCLIMTQYPLFTPQHNKLYTSTYG